jgi:hypothetical protein
MDAQRSRGVGIAGELFSSLRFTQANIEEMGNVATVVLAQSSFDFIREC